MKKIGILTFHFAINNGAVLQCLALYKYVKQVVGDGVEVKVIDYQPKYHTNLYADIINPFPQALAFAKEFGDKSIYYRCYRFCRNVVAVSKKNAHFFTRKERKLSFQQYLNGKIDRTEIVRNEEELRDKCTNFNMYITGSDQIWNSQVTNYCVDAQYYLKFAQHIDAIKISYAASAKFSSKDVREIVPLLKQYDTISVREKSALQQLQEMGFDKSRMDVDPTLLLCRSDYEEFEDKIDLPFSKYIVFYGLPTDNSKELLAVLYKIKNEYNLPIVDCSASNFNIRKSLRLKTLSPGGFLSVIKNAKCVVTDSFHGTVFSIIYNVDFWTVYPRLHAERIENLLSSVKLDGRAVRNEDECVTDPIQWNIVNRKLEILSNSSKEFLNDYLNSL